MCNETNVLGLISIKKLDVSICDPRNVCSSVDRSPSRQQKMRLIFCHGHRLCQVPLLVDIVPAQCGQMVREQLQGNDVDDSLQSVNHLRYSHVRARRGMGVDGIYSSGSAAFGANIECCTVIVFIAHDDQPRPARSQLLDHARHLSVHAVARGNDHDRYLFVNQGERIVLHLASQDTLGVKERNLLDRERNVTRQLPTLV